MEKQTPRQETQGIRWRACLRKRKRKGAGVDRESDAGPTPVTGKRGKGRIGQE